MQTHSPVMSLDEAICPCSQHTGPRVQGTEGWGWEPTNCPLCRQPRCTLQAGEVGALSAMRKLLAQALTLAAFSLAHGRIRLSACV